MTTTKTTTTRTSRPRAGEDEYDDGEDYDDDEEYDGDDDEEYDGGDDDDDDDEGYDEYDVDRADAGACRGGYSDEGGEAAEDGPLVEPLGAASRAALLDAADFAFW